MALHCTPAKFRKYNANLKIKIEIGENVISGVYIVNGLEAPLTKLKNYNKNSVSVYIWMILQKGVFGGRCSTCLDELDGELEDRFVTIYK